MLYLLAVFLPPLAVLLCGKPFQAILNCLLCLLLWIPAVIHAFIVISSRDAERRTDRLVQAIQDARPRIARQ
jgi:uncharacterized membrane protein YqaE (UPF0057 family)